MRGSECKLVNKMIQDFFIWKFKKTKLKASYPVIISRTSQQLGGKGETHDACCFHNSVRATHSSEHC